MHRPDQFFPNQPVWDSLTGYARPDEGRSSCSEYKSSRRLYLTEQATHRPQSPVPFTHGGLVCRQNFIVHSTAENQAPANRTACCLTIRDKRPGEVSLTGTRSPGRIVPC